MHAGREPHDAPAEDSFPTAAQWVGIAQQLREDERSLLLPAPLPPRPRFAERSSSSRIRQRRRRALGVWRSAAKVVAILNSMDSGRAESTTKLLATFPEAPEGAKLSLAHRQLHRRAMTESARLERWRGSSGCIGVQAAARVARSSPHEIYGAKRGPAERRVTLLADMLDEPDDDRVVEMLEALGPEDSAYYSKREHVVRGGSRSEQLYNDLVDRFVFVAGAQVEYEKYFARPLPQGMWGWAGGGVAAQK